MCDMAAFKGSGLIKCNSNGHVTIKYSLGKADWMDYSTGGLGVGVGGAAAIDLENTFVIS